MGRLQDPLISRTLGMDAEEAAKALFSLKASPIVTSRNTPRLSPDKRFNLPQSLPSFAETVGKNAGVKTVSFGNRPLKFSNSIEPTSNASDPTAAAGTLCALMQSPPQAIKFQNPAFASDNSGSSYPTFTRPRTESTLSIDIKLSNTSLNSPENNDDNDSIATEPAYATDRHRKIGSYSPNSRRRLIGRFMEKRRNRIWKKRIKYDVRKHFADSRLRVKGRFVRKEDEEQLRDFVMMC